MATALPPVSSAEEGYLLLADISGYTAFLTSTELDHSQAIIRELTTLIRERLSPPMRSVGSTLAILVGRHLFSQMVSISFK